VRHLVIATHPDDEVLGVGGTIARAVDAGDEVHVCYVTACYQPGPDETDLPRYADGEREERQREAREAAALLGVKGVHFLDLPNNRLDHVPHAALNYRIGACVDEVQPDVLYVNHGGDVHKAHRLVYEACVVIARPLPGSTLRRLLAYEVPSSTEWGGGAFGAPFVPSVYVDVTPFLDKKLRALEAYRSELRAYPHRRSVEAVRLHATARGTEVGVPAAEAFMLVREVCR
jgi:LmbE family N-acetylglucosaminyl deacetylase